ncbi:MAG: hypothetical protein U9M91_04550, partial [Chloroflexota bacterium]|nr:hypothetical protein [Chloroflexota bacterium]
MKRRLVAVVVTVAVVAVVALVLISSGNQPPDGEPPSDSTPSEAPSETTSETPSPNPPLNVRIDYFGVKNAHGGNVQLVVVVGDEDEDNMKRVLIPPVKEGYSMGDFDTKTIDQRVFHTPCVNGPLKMSILAYHRDQSKTDYLTLINWMKWYYGESIDWLEQLVLSMPEQDELIGYYEDTW